MKKTYSEQAEIKTEERRERRIRKKTPNIIERQNGKKYKIYYKES